MCWLVCVSSQSRLDLVVGSHCALLFTHGLDILLYWGLALLGWGFTPGPNPSPERVRLCAILGSLHCVCTWLKPAKVG